MFLLCIGPQSATSGQYVGACFLLSFIVYRGCLLSTIMNMVLRSLKWFTFQSIRHVRMWFLRLWEVNVLRNINRYLLPHVHVVSAFVEVNILHSKHLIYRFILIPITNSNNTSEIPITKYKLQLSIPYRNKSMQTEQP